MKFNPFDRKTASLGSPVRIVASKFNFATQRWCIDMHVPSGNLALVEKNYATGKAINVEGRTLIVTQLNACSSLDMESVCDVLVTVEAMDPGQLMHMAATGDATPKFNEAGERIIKAPAKPGVRKLIIQ